MVEEGEPEKENVTQEQNPEEREQRACRCAHERTLDVEVLAQEVEEERGAPDDDEDSARREREAGCWVARPHDVPNR
jgi:hypothetical protein